MTKVLNSCQSMYNQLTKYGHQLAEDDVLISGLQLKTGN